MLEDIIGWLERHLQPCIYKENLGFECPGCGLQRSLIELLKGNLVESIMIYPGLLPTIGLFIFLILHLIFNFKNGATLLKYIFITDVMIIMISYIIKLIN
jgi:hypothetical protein